jgi:predicted ATPase
LLASFDRIVKSGAPELVLVSGYSGIGKSSVVNAGLYRGWRIEHRFVGARS